MGKDLQVGQPNGRRTCGVVSAAWRTAATTRSGASSGPSSSQALASRSKSRSSGHAIRPSGATRRRVGLDGRAQDPGRVVESRAGRAGRDAERVGDLDQGQARRGGAGRRPPAARRSGVGTPGRARRGRRSESRSIRSRRPVDRQDTDVRRPRAPTPGLGVARMDEQAPDPGFEAIRVAQGRELAPDGDEGALQGILGEDARRAGSGRRARTSGRWSSSTSAANASRSPSWARSTRSRTVAPSCDRVG